MRPFTCLHRHVHFSTSLHSLTRRHDDRWSDSLAQSSIHARDFCASLLSIAPYALSAPSSLTHLSESLPSTLTSNESISSLPTAARKEEEITAVVFTVVDSGVTTQKEIARIVEEVVGVKVGFYGSLVSGLARLNLGGASEDANDKVRFPLISPHPELTTTFSTQHSEIWSTLLSTTSISPLTPLSPLISIDQLSPHPIDFSPKLLMELTGWKPRYPTLSVEAVREGVDGFKKEGNWPVFTAGGKK